MSTSICLPEMLKRDDSSFDGVSRQQGRGISGGGDRTSAEEGCKYFSDNLLGWLA